MAKNGVYYNMGASKKPASLKVGPYIYTLDFYGVETWKQNEEDGYHNYATMVIGIYDGLAPINKAVVALHETLHAVNHCYNIGDGDKEEEVVAGVSTGLTAVVQENPVAFKYWLGLLK